MDLFKDFKLGIPVLFIAFNRPDITRTTFQRIRAARPEKLYVAVDGPRHAVESEDKVVDQVKAIVKDVDWPCKIHYRFNDENKGAEVTVSSAIHWVFEREEYAIILEDDIIAPLSFFKFAQEMLIKYKDNEQIGTVTGSNFTPIPVPDSADYFFAKYGHSWGWATWRRAWQGFNLNVEVPDEHLRPAFLSTITNSKAESRFYKKLFTLLQKRGPGNSTWDLAGLYHFRIRNSLSIIPRVNLTSNIGVQGLHARGKTEHHFRSVDEHFVVKKYPENIVCFTAYDEHHYKTHFHSKRSIFQRLLRKVRRIMTNKKKQIS